MRLPWKQGLARAKNLISNERSVCTSRNFFNATAKTREKLCLKTRFVPVSRLKFEYQRTFNLHEPLYDYIAMMQGARLYYKIVTRD